MWLQRGIKIIRGWRKNLLISARGKQSMLTARRYVCIYDGVWDVI